MLKRVIKFSGVLVALMVANAALAQIDEPPPFDNNPPEGASSLPVDGGVSFLAAAGAAFAGKKLKARFSKKKQAAK